MNNSKAKIVITIIAIILLIICLASLMLQYSKINNTDKASATNTNQETSNNKGNELNDDNEENQFAEQFFNYLVDMISERAKEGVILKDTTGDVTADKLTEQEVVANKNNYINILKNNLNNNEIFSDKFIKDNKQCIVFSVESVLNLLGLGTHMGAGMGATDYNGMQLYVYGDNPHIDLKNNVYEEFGYDIEQIVNDVYYKIKDVVSGNLEEQSIKGSIKEELTSRGTKVVWNNGKLEITYCVDYIINEYNLNINNSNLISLDELGCVTLSY